MDLNKPITMPGKKEQSASAGQAGARRAPRGNETYPSKTTINLMACGADTSGNTLYTVLAFAAAVVLIGIFCKFCVVDPLASTVSSDSQVRAAQVQLDQLKAENADLAEVASEYERYVVKDMTAQEYSQVQRSDVIALMEDHFEGVGYLSSVALTDNTLTVTLLGASMSDVSNLVAQLEGDYRVNHVTVSTAQGQDTTATSATITVLFNDAQIIASQNSGESQQSASSGDASTNATQKGGN